MFPTSRPIILRSLVLAAFCVGVSSNGHALGLGQGRVHSHLGEPLRLVIDLIGSDNAICPRLIVPKAVDSGALPLLERGRVRIEKTGNNRQLVVTSRTAVTEPVIRVMVEVGCSGNALRREFTLFVDPPIVSAKRAQSAPRVKTPDKPRAAASGKQKPVKRSKRNASTNSSAPAKPSPTGPAEQLQMATRLPTLASTPIPASLQFSEALSSPEQVGPLDDDTRQFLKIQSARIAQAGPDADLPSTLEVEMVVLQKRVVDLEESIQHLQSELARLAASTPRVAPPPSVESARATAVPRPPEAPTSDWSLTTWLLGFTAVLLVSAAGIFMWRRWKRATSPAVWFESSSIYTGPDSGFAGEETDGNRVAIHVEKVDFPLDEPLPEQVIPSWPPQPREAPCQTETPVTPRTSSLPSGEGDTPKINLRDAFAPPAGPTSAPAVPAAFSTSAKLETHSGEDSVQFEAPAFSNTPAQASPLPAPNVDDLSLRDDERAAIDLEHLQTQNEAPATTLLRLLDLYRESGRRVEYGRLANRIKSRFNVRLPEFDNTANEDLSDIDAYPHLLGTLQGLWGSDICLEYLRGLLLDDRKGDRNGFPRHAFEDLLFLSAVLEERLAGEDGYR